MGPKKWAMWAEKCGIQTRPACADPGSVSHRECGTGVVVNWKIINCDTGHGPKEVGDVGGEMRNSDKTRKFAPPQMVSHYSRARTRVSNGHEATMGLNVCSRRALERRG